MRYLFQILFALVLSGAIAHAQEDDDDPKAASRHPSATKPAPKTVAPPAKPAKPEPAAPAAKPVKPEAAKPEAAKPETAKPETAPAAAAKTAKPDPATAATVKKAHTDEPAPPSTTVRKVEPGKKPVGDEPEPAPPIARKSVDEPARKPDSKRPSAAAAEPKTSAPAPAELPVPANARAVRVRLVDGSTVVGSVRAEQAEQLVIDCALGQLAIPRVRISTIAYDAAAGVGKRAPVQMLDDGDTLPKKKSAQ